jgi:hypothetical protein
VRATAGEIVAEVWMIAQLISGDEVERVGHFEGATHERFN